MKPSSFVVLLLLLVFVASPVSAEENAGLPELDKAMEQKLAAQNMDDLSSVVKLVESAMKKGLDAENEAFAKQLLSAAHFERAAVLTQAIFDKEGPDPRWPQLRQAALPELLRSLELNPEQPQAHMLVARLNTLPGGNREQALRAVNAIIAADAAEAELLVKAYTIRAALQTNDEKRLADFDQAIKLAPDEPEVIRARGLHHLVKEQPAEALVDLKRAVEIDPSHAGTFEALGLAQMMLKEFDASLDSFARAIELAPDAASPYSNRARVYILQEKYQDAIADLDKALEKDPNALQTLILRARVHAEAKDSAAALADVDKAIELRPGWLPALRMRAELLAGSGKISEAIEGLEQLTEALPTNSELLLQLGVYLQADNQPQRAIEIFNTVLEADPVNWLALRSRGDALLGIGKQAAAIADYEAALKVNPEHSGVLNNLAWVLATSPDDKLRNGKRAVELATKACEVTEFKQPHIISTLAAAYAETGDFAKAREWSEKAVALDDGEQKEQLTKELESYKAEKPWRELQQADAEKPADPAAEKPREQQAQQPMPARTIDF